MMQYSEFEGPHKNHYVQYLSLSLLEWIKWLESEKISMFCQHWSYSPSNYCMWCQHQFNFNYFCNQSFFLLLLLFFLLFHYLRKQVPRVKKQSKKVLYSWNCFKSEVLEKKKNLTNLQYTNAKMHKCKKKKNEGRGVEGKGEGERKEKSKLLEAICLHYNQLSQWTSEKKSLTKFKQIIWFI